MTQILTEKEFPSYIKTISPENWKTLFDLIPKIHTTNKFEKLEEMEQTQDGILVMPFYNPEPIVLELLNVVYQLGLIINFDWPSWEEGSRIICNPNYKLDELNEVDLCKLLTLIFRSDRFNEGFLICNLNDGTIGKILEALKTKITYFQ